jgi:hypothetical protein
MKQYLDETDLRFEKITDINTSSLGYLHYELDCYIQDHIEYWVGEIVFPYLYEGSRQYNFGWEIELTLNS